MRTRFTALIILMVLLTAAGCNDDGTSPQNDFRMTIKVVDFDGLPVPGLELSLMNDHPFFQKAGPPNKAAVKIEFYMPQEALGEISIWDMEGRKVRTVTSTVLPAGVHQVMWDGTDDERVQLPSTRYTVQFSLRDEAEGLSLETRMDVLMAAWQGPSAGKTSQNGALILSEKALFPHLYDVEGLQTTDEDGQFMGVLELGPAMWFQFYSPDEDRWQHFERDVTGSGLTLTFTWAPPRTPLSEPFVSGAAAPSGEKVPPYDGLNLNVYPNPFN